jgi:protein-L-isoaspartate(D-aspartate) O-methyltransferase
MRTTSSATFDEVLEALLDEIRSDVEETAYLTDRHKLDPRVMNALREVPRHKFVTEDLSSMAYANQPLPIGYGQTISQPYIVALMTDLLRLKQNDVVLEVGTGSGYQAAILAQLARQVYSVELVDELASSARQHLQTIGCENVEVRTGNGYFGWPEHAPYDAVIVTAAGSHIPPALIAQLKPGGRLVIPVFGPSYPQQLLMVKKKEDGSLEKKNVLPVRFVPLIESPNHELSWAQ